MCIHCYGIQLLVYISKLQFQTVSELIDGIILLLLMGCTYVITYNNSSVKGKFKIKLGGFSFVYLGGPNHCLNE